MTVAIYIHRDGQYRRYDATRDAGETLSILAPWGERIAWQVPGDAGEHFVTAQDPRDESSARDLVIAQIIIHD